MPIDAMVDGCLVALALRGLDAFFLRAPDLFAAVARLTTAFFFALVACFFATVFFDAFRLAGACLRFAVLRVAAFLPPAVFLDADRFGRACFPDVRLATDTSNARVIHGRCQGERW
ncbi:MAG TPA: hypothetical protein VF147_18775, partial [Vicinamibacterales bacterium]